MRMTKKALLILTLAPCLAMFLAGCMVPMNKF